MVHILPCNALQRHRSCDTYTCVSPYGYGDRFYVVPKTKVVAR